LAPTRGRTGWRKRSNEAPFGQQAIPAASKPHRWDIYHIKGTPAVLLGHVEAPDEESAIKRAIEEFKISPALQKRLLAQRRA
jgi:hypothetical protein